MGLAGQNNSTDRHRNGTIRFVVEVVHQDHGVVKEPFGVLWTCETLVIPAAVPAIVGTTVLTAAVTGDDADGGRLFVNGRHGSSFGCRRSP
jgi:hypothetical protein